MFSAFQPNAFQRNAFQINSSSGLLGGGGGKEHYHYATPYSAYQEEIARIAAQRAQAKKLEYEIALAEQRQRETQQRLAEAQAAQRQRKAIEELVALEASLQEEINRLRMERVWLMRRIDDEEAILVLLLSAPFH